MSNKYQAVMDLINTSPLVGRDVYFNFIDETNTDGNTTLTTVSYGQVVRRYVDGERVLKMQFEIRQVKPLATYSNTTANTDSLQHVEQFLGWINEQGEKGNFPQWDDCEIISMGTPEGVKTPSILGINEKGMLIAFPFEITYIERN